MPTLDLRRKRRGDRRRRDQRPGSARKLVADDLVSTQPGTPSYLRIYGTAELVERQDQFRPAPYMRITPTISWS
jgi:pyridoxamine 5'-phosphate oxidase family protein